jgi:hypothetical protein
MKAAIVLLATISLFALDGCTRKSSPQADTSEILIRHLLRRQRDISTELAQRENDILEHDNQCLKEQIAALEGHPVHHDHPDALDTANALSERLQAGLRSNVQDMLDAEAGIEEHNRKYPELPQKDLKDILRQICGDCSKDRAFRDSQLAEEAERSPVPLEIPSPH